MTRCRLHPHDAAAGATYHRATGIKCRAPSVPPVAACRVRLGRPVVERGTVSRPVRLLALLDRPRRLVGLATALDLDTSRTGEALDALRRQGRAYQPVRGLWVRTP